MKKNWVLFTVLWLASFMGYAISPLPASEVFQIEAKQVDPNTFAINWQIKPGYFLYRDRIKITEGENSNIHLGSILFPPTTTKTDHQGRVYSVYRNQLALPVPVLGNQPGESTMDVQYQGCADDGFCYPPETKKIKLTIDKNLALSDVSIENKVADSQAIEDTQATDTQLADTQQTTAEEQQLAGTQNQPSTDKVEAIFNDHWIIVILSFFGFGLLLSFTPCILPMVPVLSGIIVGHGTNISTRKAFFLSLSYVLSMSITYAIVGALVAKLGSNLQVILQTTWAIALFSLIFILLSLSMFGFYELRFPTSWQAKFASMTRSQSTGHHINAAIMGCLSTLILSPCVTAPLIGALGYIAHSGNTVLGSLALFFLGLGMGTPLILIGASAGKWLPKAGQWMNSVKAFFGVLLLAVAIYLLARILPGALVMAMWASLLIFSGIYCGALTRALTNHEKFRQGFGIILLVYGLLVLVGASMGTTNPLQPLAGLQGLQTVNSASISNKTVKTLNGLQKAIANAKGKPIMLDFYADWCTACKVMEATVFKDPRVAEVLKNFVVVKVDITANKAQQKALLSQFNVVAPPTFLFLNKHGDEQAHLRLVGETSTNEFLNQLNEALGLTSAMN